MEIIGDNVSQNHAAPGQSKDHHIIGFVLGKGFCEQSSGFGSILKAHNYITAAESINFWFLAVLHGSAPVSGIRHLFVILDEC
jgi:hypothetical protein